ncbi:Keratin-associated protein 10-8 [Liparis tanakae]|uniref:Keratin-associated protein 10-8 n=1 Tax=Liparis tanakae TaxID=230148 RepID=A0A4Z2JEQ6_9TELE|nr:Keratin-associated protein 10-8 [Liparis tanakae]
MEIGRVEAYQLLADLPCLVSHLQFPRHGVLLCMPMLGAVVMLVVVVLWVVAPTLRLYSYSPSPGGQSTRPGQVLVSVKLGQLAPPYIGVARTCRVRCCRPMLHVLLQLDQEVKSDTTQSCGQGMRHACSTGGFWEKNSHILKVTAVRFEVRTQWTLRLWMPCCAVMHSAVLSRCSLEKKETRTQPPQSDTSHTKRFWCQSQTLKQCRWLSGLSACWQWEWPVLHRPIIYRPVLFRPLLYKPILFRPILFRPILFRPILFRPILFRPILHRPILFRPVLHRTILYRFLGLKGALHGCQMLDVIVALIQEYLKKSGMQRRRHFDKFEVRAERSGAEDLSESPMQHITEVSSVQAET